MIGIDVGYGNTKIHDGNMDYGFPSVYYATVKQPEVAVSKGYMQIVLDGKSYLVGSYAAANGGIAEFDRTDIFRHKIFMLAGICQVTSGKNFKGEIGLGLPLLDMPTMAKKLEALKGKYNIEYNGNPVEIEITNIEVYVQGQCVVDELAAYDDTIAQKTIGIIDVGQKTVDVAYFDEMIPVFEKCRSFDNIGCASAYQQIAESYRAETGNEIKDYKVRNYMVRNRISEKMSEPAFQKLAQTIIAELRRLAWNYNDLDQLYLVGGGAYYIEKYFKDIPNVIVHECTVTANARAYYEKGCAKNG